MARIEMHMRLMVHQVIDAVGDQLSLACRPKIMVKGFHRLGGEGRASPVKVPQPFLLFRVDRNHRIARRFIRASQAGAVFELRVAIGMLSKRARRASEFAMGGLRRCARGTTSGQCVVRDSWWLPMRRLAIVAVAVLCVAAAVWYLCGAVGGDAGDDPATAPVVAGSARAAPSTCSPARAGVDPSSGCLQSAQRG